MFQVLVDQSRDPMLLCPLGGPADHTITYANPAVARLLGYEDRNELLGKRMVDTFVHPDDRPLIGEQVRRRAAGESVGDLRIRLLHRDGHAIHVKATGMPVSFDGQRALLVVAHDQTERLRLDAERSDALTELRASEERHRSLFEGSPVPTCVFEIETTRLLAVNPAMARVYGYSQDEMLAMRMVDIKPSEDVPELVNAVAAAQVGTIHHVGVRRHRARDGHVIEMDITAHAVSYEGRRAMLAILLDVTHTRKIEDQLRQSQKMEAVGQLAGGIAHDFNNLLAVILSSASFAIDTLGPDHPASVDLREVETSAQRAATLTHQLLAFSRKQKLKPEVLALNSLVTHLEKMLCRIVGEDVEMSAVLASQLGSVVADAGQVEQVIVNLVVNARDAMPTGGKLAIGTANVELGGSQAETIGIPPGRYVTLVISDTGCGMDAETQRRIFEPFFTTKEVGKGTGLGLSTVFGIVKQSEGGITVHSSPGQGTTFQVYLPRTDDAVAAVAEDDTRPVAQRGTETLLLVEDDVDVRRVISRQLSALGYQLFEAQDGASALALSHDRPEPFDLLLTDLVMPGGMDGRALAARLLLERPTTRVLFMSGYSEHAAVKSVALTNDDLLVEKPFTAVGLSRAIRQALAGNPVAITAP